jgi:RND superfamily putative drug exporter
MHLQIADKFTGRLAKWLVLGCWLAVFVVGGMFAGKLADVQNNEAQSWLPESAESTRAFEKLTPFQDPNAIPTVVVYERESGLTGVDLAAAQADVAEFAAIEGVVGEVRGPLGSDDGQALQTLVTFDLGEDGWNQMPDKVDELRDIARIDGVNVHVTGFGGQAADAAEAFGGLETTLLFAALGVVIVILLFVYRSPTLWLMPIISAVVALTVSLALVYLLAKYAGLTPEFRSS